MRLFFHLVDSQDTIHDLDGVEVVDLEQARTETMRAIAEVRQEDSTASEFWSGWILRVTDGSGRVVLTLALDAGVH